MVLRDMCVNWNELQYLACATGKLQPVAMASNRSAVQSPRLRSKVKKIIAIVTIITQGNVGTCRHVIMGLRYN